MMLIQLPSYLTANTASTARFKKWFGTYTSAHHTTVASHYANMLKHPYASSYEFDCTCTDANTYAYVYPDELVLSAFIPRHTCLRPHDKVRNHLPLRSLLGHDHHWH